MKSWEFLQLLCISSQGSTICLSHSQCNCSVSLPCTCGFRWIYDRLLVMVWSEHCADAVSFFRVVLMLLVGERTRKNTHALSHSIRSKSQPAVEGSFANGAFYSAGSGFSWSRMHLYECPVRFLLLCKWSDVNLYLSYMTELMCTVTYCQTVMDCIIFQLLQLYAMSCQPIHPHMQI